MHGNIFIVILYRKSRKQTINERQPQLYCIIRSGLHSVVNYMTSLVHRVLFDYRLFTYLILRININQSRQFLKTLHIKKKCAKSLISQKIYLTLHYILSLLYFVLLFIKIYLYVFHYYSFQNTKFPIKLAPVTCIGPKMSYKLS